MFLVMLCCLCCDLLYGICCVMVVLYYNRCVVLYCAMLCYVMLCYVVLCCVVLRCCCIVLCNVLQRFMLQCVNFLRSIHHIHKWRTHVKQRDHVHESEAYEGL